MEIFAAGIVGGLVSHVVGGDTSKESFTLKSDYGVIIIERNSDLSLNLVSVSSSTGRISSVNDIEVPKVIEIEFKGEKYKRNSNNSTKHAIFQNENVYEKYIFLENLDGTLRLRTNYDKKNCSIQ